VAPLGRGASRVGSRQAMDADVAYLDATELAARIRRREPSPVELLRGLRERLGPSVETHWLDLDVNDERFVLAMAPAARAVRGMEGIP